MIKTVGELLLELEKYEPNMAVEVHFIMDGRNRNIVVADIIETEIVEDKNSLVIKV